MAKSYEIQTKYMRIYRESKSSFRFNASVELWRSEKITSDRVLPEKHVNRYCIIGADPLHELSYLELFRSDLSKKFFLS